MWFAWSIISLGQIITNRYLKHYWKWHQYIHTVLGTLSGIITLASTIIVLKWLDWAFYFDHYHNVIGIVFMVLCQLLVMGGVFALVLRKYFAFEWKTKLLLKMSKIHVIFGYFMIFATQLAVTTGIFRRIEIGQQNQVKKLCLSIGNLLFFFGTLVYFEIRHQKILAETIQLKAKVNETIKFSRQ